MVVQRSAEADDAGGSGEPPLLRLRGVLKRFGAIPAVRGVDLDIRSGEFFALLGPSGCGKTTLLRLIAGLDIPDGGSIAIDGVEQARMPAWRRPVNMMFQSYALFPHLDVAANIAFGLRQARKGRAEIRDRVEAMLRLVQMEGYGRRRPDQLSGGQKQRVALARALARNPRLLLLDEPMAALDRKLREETQAALSDIRERLGITFVIVTHDQEEALALATRIGVMDQGALLQVGAPAELYDAPRTRRVASFLGGANIFEGVIGARVGERISVVLAGERAIVPVMARGRPGQPGDRILFAVRPERMQIEGAAGPVLVGSPLGGTLDQVRYVGEKTLFRVTLDAGPVVSVSRSHGGHVRPRLLRGQRVQVGFPPEAGMLLEQTA